jgi:hypothetical protein
VSRAELAVVTCLLIWLGPTVNVRVGERLSLPEVGALAMAHAEAKVYRMPDGPVDGQDTPPCGKGYVAIRKACWAELAAKAPNCPDASAQHEGPCYLPVRGAKPVPMSLTR